MAFETFLNTVSRRRREMPVSDIIFDKRGFMGALREKGDIKSGVSGSFPLIPFRTSRIDTADAGAAGMWDGGDKQLVYTQQNTVESGTTPWKYIQAQIYVVENEKIKNQGKEQVISIVDEREKSLTMRFDEILEEQWINQSGTGLNLAGLPAFMNNTDATYLGGVDLTAAAKQPLIVAIGAPLSSLTLDHINRAFSLTADGDMQIDCFIGPQTFLQQVRSLVLPQQRFNTGGNTWTLGPGGLNWMGEAPFKVSRYLRYSPGTTTELKVAYGLNMKTIKQRMAYSGDGIRKSEWFHVSSTISTYAKTATMPLYTYCDDPHENAKFTWT